MLAMTQERLGSVAMEVVRMVMVYGKLTPGDVMAVMSAEGDGQSESDRVESSRVSGSERFECAVYGVESMLMHCILGMAAVQEATVELVRNGLLQPTCPDLQVIESDLIQRRFAVGSISHALTP
jgi:hypothetical protein